MKKTAYFAGETMEGWPRPEDIKHYFLGPPGKRWFFDTGDDTAAFEALGVDGTEHLPPNERAEIVFVLNAHPKFGVLLDWSKWDGREKHVYASKGDLGRLRELVYTIQDYPLPVGLLVSFEVAWKAVKEFIETDGQLPKCIEWIADDALPPDTFPDNPRDPSVRARIIRE